jgi:hypothetical protein
MANPSQITLMSTRDRRDGLRTRRGSTRSEEAGFDRHVTKPLNPKTLPSLISRGDGGEPID